MRSTARLTLALGLAVLTSVAACNGPVRAGPSGVAAAEPSPRDCLPPPRPLDPPGPDPLGQALCRYVRGRLLMGRQETVLAAEEFRQAAALQPNVALIWMNLGLTQYDAGNVSAAVESLDKALALVPTDPATLYFRARLASNQGDLPMAADLLGRLLAAAKKESPYHILGTYHLARTRHNMADVEGAIAAYRSLLEMVETPQSFYQRYPELYLVYRSQVKLKQRLASLLLDRGESDEAIAVLREAITARPRNKDLLGLMCSAYLKKHDFEAAREWARKVIDSDPGGAGGYQRLAEVHKAEGKPDAAIGELERYHKQRPENRFLTMQLATAYESAGRKDEAADLYRELSAPSAKSSGTSVAAAMKLAEIHIEARRPVEALEALGSTMVGEVAESAVLVRAARLIDSLTDRGQIYLQARRLVAPDVTHYGPFVLVGMLAETAKRPADAISLYDKAIARQPKAAIAYSRKADLLIQARRHDAALGVYHAAVSAGLDLPIFRRKMGMILEHLGRIDEALAEYRLARRGAAGDKHTRYLLAGALAKKGRFDEAVKELKDLLKLVPKDIQARCQLGGLYLSQGDVAAAEDVAVMAQSVDAKALGPKVLLAEIRFRQERFDDAVRLARDILATYPRQNRMRLLMAYALAGLEQHGDAVAELRALLAAQPENIEWRYLLSGLYAEMGDTAAAERELERILQSRSDHAPSKNDLGYLWAERGVNLARAETMIRQALQADPKSAAYLDSLGWVMYKRGRFDDAVKMLEEATRLAPELDAVLWDHLGDSYWRLDRPTDAAKAWQAAAKILEARGGEAKPDDMARVQGKLNKLDAGAKPEVAPLAPAEERGRTNSRLNLPGTTLSPNP